ncbi:GntR family transcriptional regulator [Paracoccus sp. (in: a-proteobacteria)]|uniref:GntR family transcriptional regulator n=1 Tax=Paracoccus sp. TaxID=267 RepID=UPI0028999A62|nr:GntR family transcriptional regulator [Paracoccus sp. (in: a-proteobacteria)]
MSPADSRSQRKHLYRQTDWLRPGVGRNVSALGARERAYADLRYRILTGRLAPGTTLLEAEIAALLGLSRTPVREALIRLEEEGLIDIRPRRGVTIRPLGLQDIADILDIFSALEVRAVELAAAQGLSLELLDELAQILTEMEGATASGDIPRWSELDDRFHSLIVAACANPHLQEAIGTYWARQYRARVMVVALRPIPKQSDLEHRGILAALAAGDRLLARQLHQKHRDRADAEQLALLAKHMGTSGVA